MIPEFRDLCKSGSNYVDSSFFLCHTSFSQPRKLDCSWLSLSSMLKPMYSCLFLPSIACPSNLTVPSASLFAPYSYAVQCQLVNQSINQSGSQSIYKSGSQSINPSVSRQIKVNFKKVVLSSEPQAMYFSCSD